MSALQRRDPILSFDRVYYDSSDSEDSLAASIDGCTRKYYLMCHVRVQPTAPALLGPHAVAQAVVACSVTWFLASFKRGCIVLVLFQLSMHKRLSTTLASY